MMNSKKCDVMTAYPHVAAYFQQRLKQQEMLGPYTYSKIGGPAEYFIIVQSASDLEAAVTLAIQDKMPYRVLGSGSNIIISDEGLPGLTIINRAQGITHDEQLVTCDSGTLMSQLVQYTLQHHLSGLEEFLGIPGTVGGAVYNNSHHLTHLIGDYVQSVRVINTNGNLQILTQPECEFAYDYSRFQSTHDSISTVVFSLSSTTAAIQTKAFEALKRRRHTQPLEYPSAGCMFKNVSADIAKAIGMPPGIRAAGWLVEQSGGKDMAAGDARVSSKHANFIINTGKATAKDYVNLSNRLRRLVHDTYGIWLEREIFFLGNHPGLETDNGETS